MIISKITSKGQTTIPADIRATLNLLPGDVIAYEIKDNEIIIKKITPLDLHFTKSLESTLAAEWDSDSDNEAYNGL